MITPFYTRDMISSSAKLLFYKKKEIGLNCPLPSHTHTLILSVKIDNYDDFINQRKLNHPI